MFKNYMTIAIRNILRHKLYSFINIGGLTIGLTACILIALFVQNEVSYDRWLKDSDRIFRLETSKLQLGSPTALSAHSPGPLAPALEKEFNSAIEASTRILRRQFWVAQGELKLEETVNLVDRNFFDVLDLPTTQGNRSQVFDNFQSLIISEKVAHKYFGDQAAVGQTLELQNGDILAKVVAVLKDLPANTHMDIDFLLLLDEARFQNQPRLLQWWTSANVFTYVKLRAAEEATSLDAALPAFLDRHVPTSPGPGYTTDLAASEKYSITTMPIKDIHLYSKGRGQQKPSGDIVIVYSFSAIAFLILVIAVINFANLSGARASLRAREVALRKTVGATRRQIIAQFLGETFLTTTLALFLALVMVEILLPWFNEMIVKLLSMNGFADPVVQLGLVALMFVLTVGAGAHPAFVISAPQPATILHSGSAPSHKGLNGRVILTTLQFTISVALMIVTGVIYSQIQYVKTMDIGIDKTGKLSLYHMTYGETAAVANAIQRKIEALPEVNATSFTTRGFPIRGRWSLPAKRPEMANTQGSLRLEHVQGEHNMLDFFGAQLLAGRFFSTDYQADLLQPATPNRQAATQSGILNETAIAYLGFTSAEDALGKTVHITQTDESFVATTIVGVVADIQLRSAREAIDPMVFVVRQGPLWILNADIKPGSEERALTSIDAIWADMVPGLPLDRDFIEDQFNQYYQADEQRGTIFAYFSLLAILVSCLGLYGLAAFSAERRTREIGIRKILGAKVSNIISLLTLQFSKPVLMANIIAWPLAWYLANAWLEGFVDRVDINPLYFFGAGVAALFIASATVAGHAFKTAVANPISALRHE